MKKLAVTGEMGAGKSTACQFFKDLGAYVMNADEIVHSLLSLETDVGKKVVALLGDEIVVKGKIDRKQVADVVFNNFSLLEKLEKLLHPEVQKEIDAEYEKLCRSKKKHPLFVVEIPLLYEGNLEKHYDFILLVIAKEYIAKKRFEEKGFSSLEYENRKNRLLPRQEKIKKSHFIIENNSNLDSFRQKINKIYSELKEI